MRAMRISLILFVSVFLMPAWGLAEQLTHQIDKQATERSSLEVGETTRVTHSMNTPNPRNLKFLGITTQGYYLVQEIYRVVRGKQAEATKYSDPYLLVCPEEMAEKEKFWRKCKRTGLVVRWYRNGQKWQEGHYQDDNREGLWTMWYDNGQKLEEGDYQEGKEKGLWIVWDKDGKEKWRKNY